MKENISKVLNDLFVEVFNDILQIEEKALKEEGLDNLSVKEVHALEAIAEVENPTMSIVAKKLRVTVGTLTTAVNTLVKKGYVQRVDCKDDRRVVNLQLTQEGKEAYDVHREFHNVFVNYTIEALSDEEKRTLASTLQKMHTFFINKI